VAIGTSGTLNYMRRFHQSSSGYQCATTYRALKQPGFNRLMQQLARTFRLPVFLSVAPRVLVAHGHEPAGNHSRLLADQSTPGPARTVPRPRLFHHAGARRVRPALSMRALPPASATAFALANGGSTSAKKFPHEKTSPSVRGIMDDRKPAPVKPPSAATAPNWSGDDKRGKPARE